MLFRSGIRLPTVNGRKPAMPTPAPYGTWRSPLSAHELANGLVARGSVTAAGDDIYWSELRPAEGGRLVIVRRAADGTVADVFGAGWNARTTVHEYGGGAWLVDGGTVWFSNFDDQRVYRVDPGGEPEPITPEPTTRWGLRYADGRLTGDGRWIVCVRESHRPGSEAVNELVAVPADGSAEPHVIASGHDFYAAPRLSPDGTALAWVSWDHPRMPWDGTELYTAEFDADGAKLGEPTLVAGGVDEAVMQPSWRADGALHYVSDRSGWWNVYRDDAGTPVPALTLDAEIGYPAWVFGGQSYTFLPDGGIAAVATSDATDRIVVAPAEGATPRSVPTAGFTHFGVGPLPDPGRAGAVLLVGGGPRQRATVISVDLASGDVVELSPDDHEALETGYVSVPTPIEYPTENGLTAHGLFYPPANQDFTGPDGELPPLVVTCHGGPTAHTTSLQRADIQYLTSRGFAVVDVNFGGSSGYGREYRRRLNGTWGVIDWQDCVNAARYLARAGLVDGTRMAIKGGSGGGYATLCALAFDDSKTFACGASHFGVGDAALLAALGQTHKFESRYGVSLIGPYPEMAQVYRDRSPVHNLAKFDRPTIFFQGLEDAIVPPEQAEGMVAALAAKGVPHAYLPFEGEQHGFRKAENIVRAVEAELAFFGYVFGFTPADEIEPVPVRTADGTVLTK
jgi:dipeptidyl aminopeptidase/acylaminoacyl peptidase